jgi:hypothetical protein
MEHVRGRKVSALGDDLIAYLHAYITCPNVEPAQEVATHCMRTNASSTRPLFAYILGQIS